MLAAVLPARNEAGRIQSVLRHLLRLSFALVIPVLNGCEDATLQGVRQFKDSRIKPLQFREALGFDVPRIAGARAALKAGARHVVFIDADLGGPLEAPLAAIAERARSGEADLLLADCYAGTPVPFRQSRANAVYQARLALNQALGRADLGAALVSHGPSAMSRRLLSQMPEAFLGVPPLVQAYAVREGFTVEMGTAVPHRQLGSATRDREHSVKIAETILGDCAAARCLAQRRPMDRGGHVGYHAGRRWDLVGLEPPEAPSVRAEAQAAREAAPEAGAERKAGEQEAEIGHSNA